MSFQFLSRMKVLDMSEGPQSEFKGIETVDDTWRLSHVIWYTFSMVAYTSYPCPETGIWFLKELDSKGNSKFALIQHGWHDFDKAGNFIKSALRKGWDVDKIRGAMERMIRLAPSL
jgi:hypothetical protein